MLTELPALNPYGPYPNDPEQARLTLGGLVAFVVVCTFLILLAVR